MGTALAAACSTIALYNPQGSKVNLVLLNVCGIITAGDVGFANVLAGYYAQNQAAPTSQTKITTGTNCLLGGLPPQGQGVLLSAGTWPAVPVKMMLLIGSFSPSVPASTIAHTQSAADIDIAGLVVVPPNTAVTIQGITGASTASWAMTWEEVPLLNPQ